MQGIGMASGHARAPRGEGPRPARATRPRRQLPYTLLAPDQRSEQALGLARLEMV
jgi:hypothetical protein